MYSRLYSESDLNNPALKHCPDRHHNENLKGLRSCCVNICGVPTSYRIILDNRACDTSLSSEYHVNLNTIHLVTIIPSSTEDDTKLLSLFFYTSPDAVTVINYGRDQSGDPTLYLLKRPISHIGQNKFCTFSPDVEEEWQSLVSDIDDNVLGTAGITLNKTHFNVPIRFTPLPNAFNNPFNRSVPDFITISKQDGTHMLSGLLKTRHCGELSRLVGELQLSYICFAYLGQAYAIEHWYNVIETVCNAYEAKALFPELVTDFATVLEKQLSVALKNALEILLTRKVKACLARFVATNWHLPQVLLLTKTIACITGCYTPSSKSNNSGDVSDESYGTDVDNS